MEKCAYQWRRKESSKIYVGILSLIPFSDISSLENIGWGFLWEGGTRKKHKCYSWTLLSLSFFPFKMSKLCQYFNSDYQYTFLEHVILFFQVLFCDKCTKCHREEIHGFQSLNRHNFWFFPVMSTGPVLLSVTMALKASPSSKNSLEFSDGVGAEKEFLEASSCAECSLFLQAGY